MLSSMSAEVSRAGDRRSGDSYGGCGDHFFHFRLVISSDCRREQIWGEKLVMVAITRTLAFATPLIE